jgi:hypothetical protein
MGSSGDGNKLRENESGEVRAVEVEAQLLPEDKTEGGRLQALSSVDCGDNGEGGNHWAPASCW